MLMRNFDLMKARIKEEFSEQLIGMMKNSYKMI